MKLVDKYCCSIFHEFVSQKNLSRNNQTGRQTQNNICPRKKNKYRDKKPGSAEKHCKNDLKYNDSFATIKGAYTYTHENFCSRFITPSKLMERATYGLEEKMSVMLAFEIFAANSAIRAR
jgi:hypothetical protein